MPANQYQHKLVAYNLNRIELDEQIHRFTRNNVRIELGFTGNRRFETIESRLDVSKIFQMAKGYGSSHKKGSEVGFSSDKDDVFDEFEGYGGYRGYGGFVVARIGGFAVGCGGERSKSNGLVGLMGVVGIGWWCNTWCSSMWWWWVGWGRGGIGDGGGWWPWEDEGGSQLGKRC
ncbi:hypothetical protein E3N88_01765 [Mikania micrantha]|uniref:Uncharacterized protein n=1 Tax=Mikania micrantha TaxID=192012 RepID=A0A5N6Q211_9ASTR|nr:hypothetical protein E3N88_01765 [Mikania micrantha]